MEIKHTLYFDGENREFEGRIIDDDGNIFESGDLDEFMAAVELFHENDDSLDGIDQIDLDEHVCPSIESHDDAKHCECHGSCEWTECRGCEDEEDDDEDDEAEEEGDDSLDDWDVVEIGDRPILAKKVIHVHSIELLALAAAGIGLWKFVKNLLGR